MIFGKSGQGRGLRAQGAPPQEFFAWGCSSVVER
jgi:hypothetical protein